MKARALLPTVALFGIATGGLHPLIGIALVGFGQSTVAVALVTAAFYLGAFLGALGGRWSAGWLGYRRALIVVTVVASMSTAVLALSDLWWAWMALRLLAGWGLGTYYVIVESWTIRLSHPSKRNVNLAAYETVRLAAVALGPVVLSLASVAAGFICGALAMLAAILPMAFAPDSPVTAAGRPSDATPGAIGRAPAGLAACLVAGIYSGSFMGLGALFAAESGMQGLSASLFMSMVLLAPVLTQLPLGALADRVGRRFLMLLATMLTATFGVALSAGLPTAPIPVTVLAIAVGGLCYPLYALGLGLVSESQEGPDLLAANGWANIAYNVGAIGGPLVAAMAVEMLGPRGLYAIVSAAALLLFVLLVATSDSVCLRPGCCTRRA